MTYRAAWYLEDGVTPAPGNDLGSLKLGTTTTLTRKLKNTGDQPFTAVQFTLQDNDPGLTVTVNGVQLAVGVMHPAPGLKPGEALTVTYSKSVAPAEKPGPRSNFMIVRAVV